MPGHLRRRSLVITLILTMTAFIAPQAASAAPPSMATATIASGLVIPWDVGFLPNGQMLVTERPGRVRVYVSGSPGAALVRTIDIPSIWAVGEAGLMGIAVDVDFASNGYVYLCASRKIGSATQVNQVLRYSIRADGNWAALKVLVTGMKANNIHNGCAVEMDRSGRLWVSMGDAGDQSLPQNRSSLNGKILRMNREGGTPTDNPVIGGVRNIVYSMGHRNPQGIALRPGTTQVFAIEHGPSVNDEINRIQPGGNYGWPCFTGAATPNNTNGCGPASSYLAPLWASGGSTIATSGGTFAAGAQWADFNGQLFVSTLKESDVRRFTINQAGTSLGGPTTHFDDSWGRLRAMVYGPGGQLYVTTSNGSGDRVIRISPAQPTLARVAGSDRYVTAAALSQTGWPSGSSRVFVATGADFPDALAGAATAGHFSNPVLLVKWDQIPPATRTELNRLNPTDIVVLGGPGVVQESVRNALVPYASSGVVTRIFGANRYATAAAISSAYYAPGVPAAFIASGTGFADALAGAPAAALRDSPLLLVKQGSIPNETQVELNRLQPQQIYVLGGGGSISSAVGTALGAYTTGPVTRLAGADRYATSAAIVRAFWDKSPAYVATGVTFADALGGGAIAGKAGVPLLLVAGTSVPLYTGQEVLRLGANRLTVIGGTGAVSGGAETVLKRLMATP